jgi:hypothetical protein
MADGEARLEVIGHLPTRMFQRRQDGAFEAAFSFNVDAMAVPIFVEPLVKAVGISMQTRLSSGPTSSLNAMPCIVFSSSKSEQSSIIIP